eukprot:TRINITY_DN937_c0_g2_i1.p1 TRINITY_DN937_c0_g2~~TRINITY_DN937_c0_g2_i1.p1  ORF type:complete len:210 (+),score=-4.04 TRINITY_DN937_c0_g2_i1:416-1045(+)
MVIFQLSQKKFLVIFSEMENFQKNLGLQKLKKRNKLQTNFFTIVKSTIHFKSLSQAFIFLKKFFSKKIENLLVKLQTALNISFRQKSVIKHKITTIFLLFYKFQKIMTNNFECNKNSQSIQDINKIFFNLINQHTRSQIIVNTCLKLNRFFYQVSIKITKKKSTYRSQSQILASILQADFFVKFRAKSRKNSYISRGLYSAGKFSENRL